MADVPYNPTPTASPDATAPDARIRVSVSPEQFGAAIGRGLEKAGAGLEQASDSAFKVHEFYGKVAVDDQINKVMIASDRIRRGDPTKTVIGPDGKPQPDLGYLGTTGSDALHQREPAIKAMDDAISAARQNLKTPQQQLEFDSQTRRLRSMWTDQIGAHADTQYRGYAVGVNRTAADLAIGQITANPEGDAFEHARADLINARVKAAQIQFGDSDDAKLAAVAAAKREAIVTRAKTFDAQGDTQRAMRIIDQDRATVGEDYIPLAAQFRARLDQQRGIVAGKVAFVGSPGASEIHNAIVQQESSGNPNEPTSVDGAKGIGQITPGTFRQYAKPGEDINKPADNLSVSRRIVDDYFHRYDGDAQRVAVAYFSGPGNVAPPDSPTPWKQDRADGNGKRVSSYVADIAKRLGDRSAPGYGDAYRRITEDTELSAGAKSHAIGYLNQANAGMEIERQTVKHQVRDDQASILATGVPTDGLTIDRVERVLGSSAAQEFAVNRGLAQTYYQKTADWPLISAQEIMGRVEMLAPVAGSPGFEYAQHLQEVAKKKADDLIRQRYEDPAKAVDVSPAVAAVKQSANLNSPEGMQALVKARLAAQDSIGIDGEAQSPITKQEALAMTAPLRQMLPGQERKVLTDIAEKFETTFGDKADQAFAFALKANKVDAQATQMAARLVKKLGLGQLPADEDVRAAERTTELRAAENATVAGTADEPAAAQAAREAASARLGKAFGPRPAGQAAPPTVAPPVRAIMDLRANPKLATDFDRKYGVGAAERILEQYPVR